MQQNLSNFIIDHATTLAHSLPELPDSLVGPRLSRHSPITKPDIDDGSVMGSDSSDGDVDGDLIRSATSERIAAQLLGVRYQSTRDATVCAVSTDQRTPTGRSRKGDSVDGEHLEATVDDSGVLETVVPLDKEDLSDYGRSGERHDHNAGEETSWESVQCVHISSSASALVELSSMDTCDDRMAADTVLVVDNASAARSLNTPSNEEADVDDMILAEDVTSVLDKSLPGSADNVDLAQSIRHRNGVAHESDESLPIWSEIKVVRLVLKEDCRARNAIAPAMAGEKLGIEHPKSLLQEREEHYGSLSAAEEYIMGTITVPSQSGDGPRQASKTQSSPPRSSLIRHPSVASETHGTQTALNDSCDADYQIMDARCQLLETFNGSQVGQMQAVGLEDSSLPDIG